MAPVAPLQLCKVLNSTRITCPSPGALSNASAPVDFFLNGRVYADEAAVAEELLEPEEAQRGSQFRLDYLPDPQFSTAKREKWIKHHPGEPLTLVIHVRAGGGGAGRGVSRPGSAPAPGERPLCPRRRSRTGWGSKATSTASRSARWPATSRSSPRESSTAPSTSPWARPRGSCPSQ